MADTDDSSDAPRIYVACLHCYNSGRLHGAWFEVRADPDELHREVLQAARGLVRPAEAVVIPGRADLRRVDLRVG